MRYGTIWLFLILFWPGSLLADEFPSMVPMPREGKISGQAVFIGKARIIVCADHPVIQSGLNLIQNAVTNFGLPPLEVAAQEKAGEEGWLIILGTVNAKIMKDYGAPEITPAEPQGYAIEVKKNGKTGGVIMLSGHDPEGALYACVTFKRLISRKDGGLQVLPASVRDWPDYKYRILSTFSLNPVRDEKSAAAAVEKAKRYILEQALEYKINVIPLGQTIYSGKYSKEAILEAFDAGTHDWVRQITDFGHAHGIKFFYYMGTRIAPIAGNENNPKYSHLTKTRGQYETWGDDKLMRERYAQFARVLKYYGYDVIFVHHPDTDNENWPNRSHFERQRFGDDRVAADANLIRCYYEEIKKVMPEAVIYATVVPYIAECLQRGDYYHKFFPELAKLMPKDLGVTLREWRREELETMNRYYEGRAISMYHEPYHQVTYKGSAYGLNNVQISEQPRLIKTFYFPHPHSCYLNQWTGSDVVRLLTAQYAWNVDSPGGAADFDYLEAFPEFERMGEGLDKKVLEAAIREVYGPDHLDELVAYYRLPLRPTWVALPLILKKNAQAEIAKCKRKDIRAPDEVEMMRLQAKYGKKAVAILDKILADKNIGEGLRQQVVTLRKYSLLFKYLAPAQLLYVKANRLLEADDAKQALPLITEGREKLAAAREVFKSEQVEGAVWTYCGKKSDPRMSRRWQNEYLESVFAAEFAELEKIAQGSSSNNTEEVPPDVLEKINRRSLPCERLSGKITVDGALQEKDWQTPPPFIVNFIRVGVNSRGKIVYPQAETEVRFLYDAEGIYVGIRCVEDDPDRILTGVHKRDDLAIFKDDAIEMFFRPDSQSGKYCQLVFNVGAERLDSIVEEKDGIRGNKLIWNPDWQVKVKPDAEHGWSAEVFLPWSVFSGEFFAQTAAKPAAGAKWKAFIGRSRRNIEYSGVVWVEGFHDTKRYPELIFK